MILTFFQHSIRTVVNSGVGVRIKLPSVIQELGGKRAILFTDKGLNNAGVTNKITEIFDGLSGPVQLVGQFDDIEQDARFDNINRAIQFMKDCNADTIVALGGGSVLDTAKGVRWALHKEYNDILEGLTTTIREQYPDAKPMQIPFIAIPTTAGTGSEMSDAAVIYNEKHKVKISLVNPYLCPDIALLDPELSISLPAEITAITGMDALTHAIEGYFSTKANPMTDAYALQAIRLIIDNLPLAVKQGTNIEARANMLMASSMAIMPFIQTTNAIPVHNLAHVFGAKYGVPHGLANAVLLPEVMESLPSLYLPRINSFAKAIGIGDSSLNAEVCLEEVILFIRNLSDEINLPNTFNEYNISNLDYFVESVQNDPTGARFKIPSDIIEKIANKVAGITAKV
ncbi:iron-containing alcohol dehydrogenase [Bacillus sp. JJ1521]|uniref:iron-containing alcohol dehydrogenase n=1 Tax=Bacillus sp. JJ1521 TaxID=3122957 RepID=UPI003000DBF6